MAGKYTPDTADVRKSYVQSRYDMWERKGEKAFKAEFDRWLAQHDEAVATEAVEGYKDRVLYEWD